MVALPGISGQQVLASRIGQRHHASYVPDVLLALDVLPRAGRRAIALEVSLGYVRLESNALCIEMQVADRVDRSTAALVAANLLCFPPVYDRALREVAQPRKQVVLAGELAVTT